MSDTDKQWNDVNDAAANQEAELEKALQQAEEMQEALRQADQAISETEDKIKQLPPIGADVNTINQQLEDIKVRKHYSHGSRAQKAQCWTAKIVLRGTT